jgi:SNF2 family DNA or RNA helicase
MKNLKNKKIYQQRYTRLSDQAQILYDQFEREWFLKAQNAELNKDVYTNWVIVAQGYLHQMSGGFIKGTEEFFSPHKLSEMKEVLDNEVQNERIVIFCRFRKEMDKIQSFFQNDYKIRQIHGGVDVHTRMEYIDELGEDKINLLVCQIKTAGVGINMSCCDTCFYYSNTWENADRLQSEDRLVGPKTEERSSLLYVDFLTEGTIDVDLYNALQAKKKNTDLDFLSSVYNTWKEKMSGGKK